jgi:hypothetical protein
MNKTDNILEKLKAAQQPTVDNPDELTDLIMDSLPEQDAPLKEQPAKPHAVLLTLRIVLSMAAVYLVGLFIYLQAEPTNKVEIVYNNKVESPQPAYCTEGSAREILMCYLERKREQPSTYSLIKQKIYESQH